MKERPILFSAPMVRALLAGTKTQTRHIVKARYRGTPDTHDIRFDANDGLWYCERGQWMQSCPYGVPGDRLWVRETWACPGAVPRSDDPVRPGMRIEYRASEARAHGWRPAIHMPRWACRLVLEVTGVRVERLQDITEADARAEGAPLVAQFNAYDGKHITGFARMWASINGEGSWETNPWVWVIEFRRTEVRHDDSQK